MSKRVVLAIYRSLLKEARHISRSEPLTMQSLPFVTGGPQVVPITVAHHNALESVLPATAMAHAAALPHNDLVGAMAGADILAVTRACFRAGAGERDRERIQSLVNEGFFAIRALGHQRSVQDRISVAVTKGLRVTATSQLMTPPPPREPTVDRSIEWQDPADSSVHRVQLRRVMSALPSGGLGLASGQRQGDHMERSIFEYRIRIDNIGEDTVTVLGREWRIFNGDGSLHREIRRGTSESQMVVGLQPILEPGDSFIYHSGTDVKSRSGHMEGSFQVANGAVHSAAFMDEAEAADLDVYYARVAPFQLVDPSAD